LASPTVHGQTIRHGESGLIYRSLDEFAARLDRLVRDAPFRRRLAANAYRFVADNRLVSRHVRARYDWYRQMLDRRAELNGELRQLVPELFHARGTGSTAVEGLLSEMGTFGGRIGPPH
jgi:hypothetical protein